MRVLIADRNGWLLESISRTFARQFSIQTARTHERCNELLLQGEFDLAVISEKLADGPGLRLLGQIARDAPDTLRVLAARRSRLRILKGKLGPLGLFRTLAYPIDARELLSMLTLARAGLEVELGPSAVPADVPVDVPGAVRPAVERISLTSADAVFVDDVPMKVALMGRARRARSVAPGRAQVRQAAPQMAQVPQVPQARRAPPQVSVRAETPPRMPSQGEAFQRTLPKRNANSKAVGSQRRREGKELRHTGQRMSKASARTGIMLGATIAAVFLVTALTLNSTDTNAQVTGTSAPRRAEIAQPEPPQNSTPVDLTPTFSSATTVAQRVQPKAEEVRPDVESTTPPIAQSATPIADPSSFGSEAYEIIYSN